MKRVKLFSVVAITIFVYLIYALYRDARLNYVSLGDSVAAGQNPYGEIGYGYTDYIRDYLDTNKLLSTYHDYAVSGYKTTDIIRDINNNIEKDKSNIRNDLRESDLVTISIGANDFMSGINISAIDLKNIDSYYKMVDKVINNVDTCLKLVREYAKDDIVVVGYYNPFPMLFNKNEKEGDELFNYADTRYIQITDKYDIKYLSIYTLFKNNSSFLPNPFDIHPNIEGYKNIADLFIKNYFK